METKNTINQRFIQAVNYLILVKSVKNKTEIADNLNLSKSKFSEILNERMNVGIDTIALFCLLYEIRVEWIISGKGKMLRPNEFIPIKDEHKKIYLENIHVEVNEPSDQYLKTKNKLIPLYNDVASIGGVNILSANVDATSSTTEYIDAGDFFPDASAAIRHYGDSMVEYPNGSIIVLKEVLDQRLLIWGKSYCIETTEGRITKKLNTSINKEILIGYSSNKDVYPDGSLIHQPVEIPKDMIRKMYLVLGSVNKEYSSGSVKIIEKTI